MKTIMELCDVVRETAYAIHVYHGHGHLEKVYENALTHRLGKLGITVQQQHPLTVYDEDGTLIGEYFADLLVDGRSDYRAKGLPGVDRRAYGANPRLPEISPDRRRIAD